MQFSHTHHGYEVACYSIGNTPNPNQVNSMNIFTIKPFLSICFSCVSQLVFNKTNKFTTTKSPSGIFDLKCIFVVSDKQFAEIKRKYHALSWISPVFFCHWEWNSFRAMQSNTVLFHIGRIRSKNRKRYWDHTFETTLHHTAHRWKHLVDACALCMCVFLGGKLTRDISKSYVTLIPSQIWNI